VASGAPPTNVSTKATPGEGVGETLGVTVGVAEGVGLGVGEGVGLGGTHAAPGAAVTARILP